MSENVPNHSTAATTAPALVPAAAKPVVRRGRGNFTGPGLRSDVVETAGATSTSTSDAKKQKEEEERQSMNRVAAGVGSGIANRVFSDLYAQKKAKDAAAAAATAVSAGSEQAPVAHDGYVPLTAVEYPPGMNAHPNLNKNRMNRPSAKFAPDSDDFNLKNNSGNENPNINDHMSSGGGEESGGGMKGPTLFSSPYANTGRGGADTVREQLFRKERRKRSIVIVGDTFALNRHSTVRLSNYSEKKPSRLEKQFLKGVHVSVPLRYLRSVTADDGGREGGQDGEEEEREQKEIDEEKDNHNDDRSKNEREVDIKFSGVSLDDDKAVGSTPERAGKDDVPTEKAAGEEEGDNNTLTKRPEDGGEKRAQQQWEQNERDNMRRERRQKIEALRKQAQAFDDGVLHPLTVAGVGGLEDDQRSFDHALNSYGPSHHSGDINPLLISPVLTCSRFGGLKDFFLDTFYRLWSLEDNKSQKVSIKLEFGKAFYTRSSRASSFSTSDFQRQSGVPFSDFVGNLNKETSQLYFINDAPLTVARGLDAISDARERASYTLVKIFFFSKERQSHIVVRAIWDKQHDCFELTDIEHIGITFSWLVLNLSDVSEEEQIRSSNVGDGEGVFLRHALPVELQFRAFQRKKTIVGHPLEKKAKFILRKLTAAEHDRLRHGYGSYDTVDFHAIARTETSDNNNSNNNNNGTNNSTGNTTPASLVTSPTSRNGPPISSMFGAGLTNRASGITPGDVPRLTRSHRTAAADNAAKKKTDDDVVEINDDEYEVSSINIEHIETRKTKTGILLDSASGLLIEHFEDHLARRKEEAAQRSRVRAAGADAGNDFGGNEEGEDDLDENGNPRKLNAGLTFSQYRSCNIHWKMDPQKTVEENLYPALPDALGICERVLDRANTFEHEEHVASKRRGGNLQHGGGRFAGDGDHNDDDNKHNFDNTGKDYHNNRNENGTGSSSHRARHNEGYGHAPSYRSGGLEAIGEGFVDDLDYRQERRGGGGDGRRGGGIAAIDHHSEQRNQPHHRNQNHQGHHHTSRGNGRFANHPRGGRGGGFHERGRGGRAGGGGGSSGFNNRATYAANDDDIWDMPESNYRPGAVPQPLPHFFE